MKKNYRYVLLGLFLAVAIGLGVFKIFYTPDIDSEDAAYVLAGSLQPRSAVISFKTFRNAKVRVELSTEAIAYTDPLYSDYVQTEASNWFLGKVEIDSLTPNTQYYYRLEVNDSVRIFDGYSGTFKTPQEGAFSYNIAFAACAKTGSDSKIFEQIASEEPLVYFNIGDLHYGDIDSDCVDNFAEAYYRVFSKPEQAALYRQTAFAYMWDDHDYGNNDSGYQADCRSVALDMYKDFIPHYDLAFQKKDAPVSQAFTIGRLRFIMTDLRSYKIEPQYDGCERISEGSNFGLDQHLTWFKNEMLKAKNAGQMVVWISGIPFINSEGGPNYKCDEDDDWGGFPEERAEIASFVEKNNIPACILSGDAHMVAIDDGTNSAYGSVSGKGMPVFQAAPLDRYGSYKGGPYSHGYNAERGQYGFMEVQDNNGEEICIRWTAKNEDGGVVKNERGEPIQLEFCRKLPARKTGQKATAFKLMPKHDS